MRYGLLPDPGRINVGFMLHDRVDGLGDAPAPANTTTPGFWSAIGTEFTDLTRTFAPGLVSWAITGNRPQPVVTPQGTVGVIPGGTKTVAAATGSAPTWLIPALIGGAALLFFVSRKK
jgi:hypothetical protein